MIFCARFRGAIAFANKRELALCMRYVMLMYNRLIGRFCLSQAGSERLNTRNRSILSQISSHICHSLKGQRYGRGA